MSSPLPTFNCGFNSKYGSLFVQCGVCKKIGFDKGIRTYPMKGIFNDIMEFICCQDKSCKEKLEEDWNSLREYIELKKNSKKVKDLDNLKILES